MTLASRLLASGLLAFFLLGALPALFGVALPLWSGRFGLAPGEGGTILAAYNGGAVLAVALATLGAPGLTMRTALLAVAGGCAAMALGPTWGLLLLAAALAGTGYGVLAATVNRRFLSDFGARGAGMVSLVNGVYGLGSILAPLLFLAAGSAPPPVLWAAALLALLALALAPPEPSGRPPRGLPPLTPRLLVLLVNAGAVSIEAALIVFGASALQATGTPPATAARLVALFFVLFVAARFALAALGPRVAPDRVVLAAALGVTACMGLAAAGAPALGFVLSGAVVAIGFPAFFVWATRLLGPDPRIGALILASGLLAGALGPLALRPILSASGEGALFWILFPSSAALSLALLALLPRLRRLPPF